MAAAAPTRTCIGCGHKAMQRQLVRLWIEGGHVKLDGERKGGRGAWLHPAVACLERAARRRAFARAFRSEHVFADLVTLRLELTRSARKD